MSKRSNKTDFSPRERDYIKERDFGCIFCLRKYHMEDVRNPNSNLQIMHLIPRSHGGLGIRQNAAIGCVEHHQMFDNGSSGRREEMEKIFREYLNRFYPGFADDDRIYKKWQGFAYEK